MNGQGAGFEEIFPDAGACALAEERDAARIFYPQFVWITLCIRGQQRP
jgi:hypothetical protein